MPFALTDAGVARLTTGPGKRAALRLGGITDHFGLSSTYETIYRSQPAIRTNVRFLATNLVGLGATKLYERVSDDERHRRHDHPLDRLMRRPDPRLSRARWWLQIIHDVLIFDNAVAVKGRVNGNLNALIRVPPRQVVPIGGDASVAEAFRIGNGPPIPADQVVHIAGYNPDDARWGLSPIETLRAVLAEDIAASEARGQFWNRASRMDGWISRPADAGTWSDPARANFRTSWRDRHTADGPDAGGTPILEDGMEFHTIDFNFKAAQYLEARKLTAEECSRAYFVHPSFLGGTNAGDPSLRRSMYADTFGPLCNFLDSELFAQLIGDFEPGPDAYDRFYFELSLDAKLRGHFLDQAEVISRSVGAPWLTRNEARTMVDRSPIDGADELIVPLNVTSGGRASPADTAPGTPGLGQASRSVKRRTRAAFVAHAKALDDLPDAYRTRALELAATVADLVDRQTSSFTSRRGGGQGIETAFEFDRWVDELHAELMPAALDLAETAAADLIVDDPAAWSLDVATPWLEMNSRNSATNFQTTTLGGLQALGDEGTTDLVAGIFAAAAGVRAVNFALGRTTTVVGFARHDAAHALGLGTKTWRTHSANARPSHAALSGVSIDRDSNFTVGASSAPWPGHPDLPADEVAGCTCTVDFS